jgi:hypothetical protein
MCVRPILITSAHSAAFDPIAPSSAFTAGTRRSATLTAIAMCIADGNVSFDDWDMLT